MQPSRTSLAEISHLFLSSVREKHSGGAARPVRKPPSAVTAPIAPVDISPEELAVALHVEQSIDEAMSKPVTVLIASHFGEYLIDRARQYAAHLARGQERVGLVLLNGNSIRISCFDHEEGGGEGSAGSLEEILGELNCDVDQWVIASSSAMDIEAQKTLLVECTQQGVIQAYKALKQIADWPNSIDLAVVEARDLAAADRVYANLANAGKQFLNCELVMKGAVLPANDVAEHAVVNRAADSSVVAIVTDFFARDSGAKNAVREEEADRLRENPGLGSTSDTGLGGRSGVVKQLLAEGEDVIELPADEDVVSAYLHQANFIVCPFDGPSELVKVAIDGENNLVLVAEMPVQVADLAQLLESRHWAVKNISLIGRAMNCAVAKEPQVHVLVADQSASGVLRAMGARAIEFRKLRWQGRTGVLFSRAA